MKKSLLFVSALALSAGSALALQPLGTPVPEGEVYTVAPAKVALKSTPAKAPALAAETEQTLNFHYYSAGDEISALSYGDNARNNDEVWEAIELPETTVNAFAGSKLTAINIITPFGGTNNQYNYVTDVTLYLTKDLDGTPFYTQTASLPSTAVTEVSLELDTPYEIKAGEPFYIGYYFALNNTIRQQAPYYIAIDGVATEDMEGCWIALKRNGVFIADWSSAAPMYGNLLIGATVEGTLPVDMVSAVGVETPDVAYTGEEFEFAFYFKNQAANDIKSVEVEYSVNGNTPKTASVAPAVSASYGQQSYVVLKDVCDAQGLSVPVSVKITGVNGTTNGYEGRTSAEGSLYSIRRGNGFQSYILMEEATSNTCPWCPLGIVAFDYVKQKYDDGVLIPVGVHTTYQSNYGPDPMLARSYQSFFNLVSGFPTVLINRTYSTGFPNSAQYIHAIMDEIHDQIAAVPAYAKVDLYLEKSAATPNIVKASAQTKFAFDVDGKFRLAFIVVEDGVGPYTQLSNLNGTAGMGSWTTAGSQVRWTYDDVARDIFDFNGLSASEIESPTAGEYYTYDYDVSLANVKNVDNARVIATLIDVATGEIVNSREVALAEVAGVSDAEVAANVSISAQMGGVAVSGANTTEVYTVDGRRAATAYGEANIALPAGLYIVKADDTVKKVVVK